MSSYHIIEYMRSYELFAELASKNRLAIIYALEKGPLKFSQIATQIGATSPELSRQLNRLMDVELIQKDAEGVYSLSPLSQALLPSMASFEVIGKFSKFFRKHDVSSIPPELSRRLDALEDGEVIEGVFVLMERVDRLFEEISEYSWYLSNDFPRFYISRIKKKLHEGVEIRVLYPESLIDLILSESDNDIIQKVEMRAIDEVNIIINVSDSFGLIALPGPDGIIDRDMVLLGRTEQFKQWCRDIFEYYRARGREYLG